MDEKPMAVIEGVSPEEFAYLTKKGYTNGIKYDPQERRLSLTREMWRGLSLNVAGPLEPQLIITNKGVNVVSTGPVEGDISSFVEDALQLAAEDEAKDIQRVLEEYRR